MTTRIKDPEDGKMLDIVTQQYQVGLYVAVYDGKRCIEQYNLDVPEEEFHKHLKEINDGLHEVGDNV